jgi:hypothetical protein
MRSGIAELVGKCDEMLKLVHALIKSPELAPSLRRLTLTEGKRLWKQ